MAKKRINFPFVVITLLVLCLIGGAAAVVYKYKQKDPRKAVKIAEELFAEGRIAESANHFAGAAQGLKDPAMFVKAGDMMMNVVTEDDRHLGAATSYYSMAIQTDPGYVPAMEKLLDVYQDMLTLRARRVTQAQKDEQVYLFNRIEEISQAILRAQPDHMKARLALNFNTVERWMAGGNIDPEKLANAIKTLEELQQTRPDDADLPYTLARAKIYEGQQWLNREDKTEMINRRNEAEKIMTDAVAAHPDQADFHFRAGLVYQMLIGSAIDREATMEKYKPLIQKAGAEIARTVKPTDENYVDCVFFAARMAMADADMAKAEKLYAEAMKAKPADLSLRMSLAELLSANPARREEAITLLRSPVPASEEETRGVKGQLHKTRELLCEATLVNLLIDQYAAAREPAEREPLRKEISTHLDPMVSRYSEAPIVLRLRGKMELVSNDNISALQTLSKALAKTDPEDPTRFETMFLLARANMATQQTAKAKALLSEIVTKFEEHIPSRMLLTNTLIEERDFDGAKRHIEYLMKAQPDNPDVVRLSMLIYDPKTQQAEIKATIDKLPQGTRREILNKANIAAAFKLYEEARVLIEGLLKETPGDADAAILLSQYWQQAKNDTAKALEVLQAAQKANPQSQRLVVAIKTIQGESVGQAVFEELDKMPEGEDKLRALIDFYTRAGDAQKMLASMQALEKISPNDPVLVDRFFAYYLGQRDFANAQKYLDKLLAANQDKAGGKLYKWHFAIAKGNLDEARELAVQLTRDNPEFAQSWVSLAQTTHRIGETQKNTTDANAKFEEAIPYYIQALDRQATNADAYLGIIDCFYKLQRYPDAKKYIEQASRTTGRPVFQAMLNEYEVRYGDPETVITQREAALKNNPDNPSAYMSLHEAYRAVASQRMQKEDEKGAGEFLGKAYQLMAGAVEKFPNDLRMLSTYSDLALMAQKAPDAEKRWQAYAAGPGAKDSATTAMAVSSFYARAGKLPEAEKTLRDELAQKSDAQTLPLQLSLAELLENQGKYDEALAALEANQDNAEVLRRRVDLLIRTQKFAEAEKALDEALSRTQGPALDLLTVKAALLLGSNRVDEGMKLLNERVLGIDPAFVPGLVQRGQAYHNSARYAEAIADLSRARELLLNAEDPLSRMRAMQARQLLAESMLRSNNVDGAINELEAVLSQDKAQKSVRLRLLALYTSQNPPRLSDAERIVREAREVPTLVRDADMLSAEAAMWSMRGDHGRALQRIQEAIQQQPGKQQLMGQMHQLMLAAKQYQQLIQFIDRQPQQYKESWWVMRDRATALYSLGDKQNGLNAYAATLQKCDATQNPEGRQNVLQTVTRTAGADMAIKLMGDRVQTDPNLKLLAATLYQSVEDLESARRLTSELLASSDLPAQVRLGALQVASSLWLMDPGKDFSRAKEALLELTKLTPNEFAVWNNLACIETNSPAETLEYSQKAYELMLKLNRQEPLVLDTYGAALLQNGKTADGINVLLDAYRAQKFKDVCLHLAEGYIATGEVDEATKYLTEAQALLDKEIEAKNATNALSFQDKIADAQRKLNAARTK